MYQMAKFPNFTVLQLYHLYLLCLTKTSNFGFLQAYFPSFCRLLTTLNCVNLSLQMHTRQLTAPGRGFGHTPPPTSSLQGPSGHSAHWEPSIHGPRRARCGGRQAGVVGHSSTAGLSHPRSDLRGLQSGKATTLGTGP